MRISDWSSDVCSSDLGGRTSKYQASYWSTHARRKRVEAVEKALCDMFCNLAQGTRLPPERTLAAELRVSRGTLRKALERLEARGRIWRHVGRGTFVGPRPASHEARLSVVSEATSPHELMEMRLSLEPQIARLASMRATEHEIGHMRYCVRKTGTVTESQAYELWDATLHRAIAQAAHNTLLLAVFDAVNEVRSMTEWGRLRDIVVSSRAVQLAWWRQHEAFVEAIAVRDAD